MWNVDIEQKILTYSKDNNVDELNKIRSDLFEKHKFLTYSINRMNDEYGDQIESDENLSQLFVYLSDEYSVVERLFRVMKAYEKNY